MNNVLERRLVHGSLVTCLSCLIAVVFYCITKVSENEFETKHIAVVAVLLLISLTSGIFGVVIYKCGSKKRDQNLLVHVTDKEKDVSQLSCEHQFHTECISKWLDKNSSCPICRNKHQNLTRLNVYNEQKAQIEDHANSKASKGDSQKDIEKQETPEMVCTICLADIAKDKKVNLWQRN